MLIVFSLFVFRRLRFAFFVVQVVFDLFAQREVCPGGHAGRLPPALADRTRHQMREDLQVSESPTVRPTLVTIEG